MTAEMALIRRETLALIEAVITLGRGDIAQGIVTAFQSGALDIPFAPSIHSRGDAMCVRDIEGAVRFLNVGKLPFDRETCQFHKEAIQERRRAEGITERDDFKLDRARRHARGDRAIRALAAWRRQIVDTNLCGVGQPLMAG